MDVCKPLIFFMIISFLLGKIENSKLVIEKESTENLSKFTCNVVDSLVNEYPETKTIALTVWPTYFVNYFTNEIGKCLSREVAVVSIDLRKKASFAYFNPSFIIMICDKIYWVNFEKKSLNIFS